MNLFVLRKSFPEMNIKVTYKAVQVKITKKMKW